MTDKEQKYGIILAGLLFDIGKFVWMSNPEEKKPFEELSLEFFSKYLKDKVCIKPVANLISDLISGKEKEFLPNVRQIFVEAEKLEQKEEKNIYPLRPIFPSIKLKDEQQQNNKFFYYLPTILNKDNVFPIKTKNQTLSEEEKSNYLSALKNVYENFVKEVKKIPDYEISSFVDSLLFVYEKHLVYINSSLNDNNSDVSLYDHTKTIAALSVCKAYSDDTQKPFLIVASDVSGIQQFIYGETERASKKLRGRSFYVGLLTELFTDYLLQKFDLPRTNVLMNGGGHFVMIVPNNKKNKEILNQSSTEIQKWLFNNFKGDINLPVFSIEADDALYKDFQKWYNIITAGLVEAKREKGFQNLKNIFNYDLDSMDIGEYKATMSDEQNKEMNGKDTEYEKNMVILSSLFENLGGTLPKTKYIVRISSNSLDELIEINNKYNNRDNQLFLLLKNFNIGYLFTKNPKKFLAENKERTFKNVLIQKINDTDIFGDDTKEILDVTYSAKFPVSFGFNFMGNYAPMENGNVLEFEKLAVKNNEDGKELGYPLLATLRMDVDNLGTIFSQGLKRDGEEKSLRTLSRTVGLSRGFNLFFGGYLNNIAEKWDAYVTYSGGDDLFIVASWINATNFAVQVKEDYNRFVCENNQVTISGGLYYHKEHYPIGRAAEFAGEAEEEAKKLKSEDTNDNNATKFDKNAISAFGKPLKWKDFLEYYKYAKDLDSITETEEDKKNGNGNSDKIKPSYLHFLLQQSKEIFDLNLTEVELSKKSKKEINEIKIDNYFRTISKIKYYLARKPRGITASEVEKVNNKTEGVSKKVELLAKLINKKEYLENLVIPASYVILKHRDSKK